MSYPADAVVVGATRAALRRLSLALLDNALKYSRPGGMDLYVSLRHFAT